MVFDFQLSRRLTPTDHAALEAALDRAIEAVGPCVNVLSIDLGLRDRAREWLEARGYQPSPWRSPKTVSV